MTDDSTIKPDMATIASASTHDSHSKWKQTTDVRSKTVFPHLIGRLSLRPVKIWRCGIPKTVVQLV